jgi:hypothetical protein
MSYLPDFSNLGAYPSPERDEDDEETSPTSSKGTKPAAKRKRENRYKNAPPAVLSVRLRFTISFLGYKIHEALTFRSAEGHRTALRNAHTGSARISE